VLDALRRREEALAYYDKALEVKPDYAEAHFNRAVALTNLNRPAEAVTSFDSFLTITPNDAEAWNYRGSALRNLNRPAEALASYDRALALKPNDADVLNNRGLTLAGLGRYLEALSCFEGALAVKPDNVEALNNRGAALIDLNRAAEALATIDQALAIEPDHADALCNRGMALRDLKRPAEALASFEAALAIQPGHRNAFTGMAAVALANCDWSRTEMIAGELALRIAERNSNFNPFTLLGYSSDPLLQLECARRIIKDKMPKPTQPLRREAIRHHDKLRVAYLSADFRQHVMALLMVELFEAHDRRSFETVGVSFGPDDNSGVRARVVRALDQFHDVRSMSDFDVAKLLSDLEVDIVVDLNGHTQFSRPGIFAHRPAPIQVSYLGYPGTMGADFIDYVIADKTALPFDQQPFYTEKIVHLPECYQVNHLNRKIAHRIPTRRENRLPDEGFVFCCFNNNYKITPPVFDVWMRLLGAVPGSMLWLVRDNSGTVQRNLRKEAATRGIDPDRMVFADRVTLEEYLARYRLADLFVDTLPYNAHGTAGDALWAGLPLLTCRGTSFAGRAAASLLYAAGLPELVTSDLVEYEALALRLATDAELLRGFRHRLEQNRSTHPLFDTDRFRRHIESAYTTMWEIRRRGESPRSFSVEPMT
jgi:predicted O-linked N-acetylglucosamine transferase (SPINDLY family)